MDPISTDTILDVEDMSPASLRAAWADAIANMDPETEPAEYLS